ncbi:hypothetical protein EDC04DRAFT_2901502 [Pisolithus marmoratus]|nr:hypothetical protein EDC04DRAFT_2901502 [Pisolithus marmoratus]
MAEHDTIKSAFQALIGVLKLPEDTNPLSFSLTSINLGLQESTSERVQLSKDEFPGLRFWVWSDYDSFTTLPEAQSMDCGKAPWLEQANGNPITADQLRAICASLRCAWAELVQCKLVLQMWTKISATAKSLVYKIMVKEHPLLGLDEDGFKLEMLCVNDYSGWRKNHLTLNGEWKEPSHKTEPKEAPKLEYTDIVSPLAMKGKKHESDPKLVRERTKRHKAESAALAGLSSLSRHNSNKENAIPPFMKGITKAPQLSTLSRHNSNKENEFSLQDPLHHFSTNVFGMNGITKKPSLAPTYPSMPPASQEPLEPSTAKMKKSKMCPGAAKNAR